MVITQQDKEAIAAQARKRASDHRLSQSMVATQSGVSKTIITWMFSDDGKWKQYSISDKQWMSIATWCRYDFNEQGWKIVRTTRNFKRFYNMCQHAHDERMMSIISDLYGRGKSSALKEYAHDHPGSAIYLQCEPSFYQAVFLRKLGKMLGVDAPVRSIADALDEITDKLLSSEAAPIIILDEWNDLPNGSKLLLKSIYNRTEGRVAYVICGGQNLEQMFKYGVARAKQGFQEIWSRGGGKTLNSGKKYPENQLTQDIIQICMANGLYDDFKVMGIVNNFRGDFREVKRAVEDDRREMRKASRKDNTRQLQLQEAI